MVRTTVDVWPVPRAAAHQPMWSATKGKMTAVARISGKKYLEFIGWFWLGEDRTNSHSGNIAIARNK